MRLTLHLGDEVLWALPRCPTCQADPGAPCKHARYGKALVTLHPARTRNLEELLLVLLRAAVAGDGELARDAAVGGQPLRELLRRSRESFTARVTGDVVRGPPA